jgi:hypothetical protein
MRFITLLLLTGLSPIAFAQEDTAAFASPLPGAGNSGDTTVNVKAPLYDSTYYRKYENDFIVALYTSVRSYGIDVLQTTAADSAGRSALSYRADANEVTGIEINYDKFSFSFGIKSKPPDTRKKGKTTYQDIGFSFGGNRWILETSYRGYRGFYDVNTSRYDTTYTDSLPYYNIPSMANSAVRGKFLYFFNHRKFSYKSGYTCTYRQLKSAFSWVMVSNIYYNKLAADTSIVPHFVREYYGQNAYLNHLGITAFSAGAGFSGNIVILKSLFLNITFVIGPETQWRRYGYYGGGSRTLNYLTAAGDFRVSFGVNMKRFFMTLSSRTDFSAIHGSGIKLDTKFYSGAFTIGYRFKKESDPPIMEKIRKTRLYSWL